MLKRMISMLLALVMVFTAIPWTAVATEEQSDVTVQSDNLTVEGSNGIGNLLSAEIEEVHDTEEAATLSGCVITDLVVDGNTATVSYDAAEAALLVVALYSEDGLQMLTSASAVISAESAEASVSFAGEMPDYFLARAYLVDPEDASPKSQAYETPVYTQAMQELLNSTVDDYDPTLVLNFDDDPTTNFAVYHEGVIRVEETEGINTVVTNDDENLLYVIENADETFTTLQPGDVVSYFYGEEELLLCKVASVTVDGTTVTIHGENDLIIEDVFDYVKVEQDGDTSDFAAKDLNPDDGIEIADDSATAPMLYGDPDDDIYIKDIIPFVIEEKKLVNEDGILVKISGNLSLELTLRASYYKAKSYRYIRVKLDYSLGIHLIADGKAKVTTSAFADIVLVNYGVFSIRLAPAFVFEVSGKIDLSITADGTIGFVSESTRDEPLSLNTNPKFVSETEGKLIFSAGIDLQPVIAFIHDKLVSVTLSVPVVGVCELVFKSTHDSETSVTGEASDYIHDCTNCLEGRFYFTIKIDLSVKLLTLKHDLTIQPFLTPEQKFHYSFDHKQGGSGACPFKRYLVVFEVLAEGTADGETAYSPVENAAIVADNVSLQTNENGLAQAYFNKGRISGSVTAEGIIDAWTYTVRNSGQKFVILFDSDELLFDYFIEDSVQEGAADSSAVIDSGSCGEGVEWTMYGSGILNIYGTGEMSKYNSASSVPWHSYRSRIRNVIISGDVTSVCNYAFSDCSDLYGVFLCDTVTSIGSYAFKGCGFTWISLPESVESIGGCAFQNCINLREVEIPGGITSVPASAFYYCSNLTSVKMTPRVKSIGAGAFSYCTKLETVEGMLSVESIGEGAFSNCSSLKEIRLPEGLWFIGSGAFSGCNALTYVEIPDSVTAFGTNSNDYYEEYKNAGTFFNCTGLKSVRIGSGLKEIPGSTFGGCTALESVSIGGAVTKIGYRAFAQCPALTSITIPASVTQIETYAFTYSGLKEIWFMGNAPTFISDYSGTCQCFAGVSATAYYPEGDETWDTGVRKSYKGSITWRAYTALDSGTLDSGLEWVLYPSGMLVISGNGGMYDYEGWSTPADVPWDAYREKITGLTINSGVTSIGPRAFYQCSNLKTVSLASGITSIGDYAFTGCAFTSIAIPDTVTSIGAYAFNGSKLTEATIPDNVKTIGKRAYYYCTDLERIHIGDSVITIGESAFEKCEALHTLSGMSGVKNIGTFAFYQDGMLRNVTLPDTLETIDVSAFSQCDSIVSVSVPDSTRMVGGNAFYSCDALTEVNVGDSVTSIGEYAFSECAQLKNVTLGNQLCVLYKSAFSFCSSLESIVIPASLYDIETDAFRNCTALSQVRFAGNAPEFGLNVFANVTANAYYPEGDTSWTEEVMSGCGGTLTWIAYTPANSMNQSTGPVSGNAPTLDAIYGGEYGSEVTDEQILRTATFSGLVPNAEYVLLAMVSIDTVSPLEPDNLLYISQAAAGEDGSLTFTYVQRITTDPSYVVVSGPARKSLAYAVITFPEMTADGALHTVNPTVVYDGVTLQEGRDYVITGTVSYTGAGTYVCFIRGIHNYSGTMKCTYTVAEAAEPEEPEVPTDPTDPTNPEEPTDPVDPEEPTLSGVIRIAGADRIDTSLGIADQLKRTLDVDQFSTVIVASALNFPDALTGSYLAAVKSAPILLTYHAANEKIAAYIGNNLAPGGTVYILGGSTAVSDDFEKMVSSLNRYTVKRLAGSDRFGTNLAILEEAGVSHDQEILICTATGFADSLSASAAGLPILLAHGTLREDQKRFLEGTSGNFVIIGGTSAVSSSLEAELDAIGDVERVAGENRYQTSVKVAKEFVSDPDAVVLAYARNFPDGLCGGPLAIALNAPLVLTDNYDPSEADTYVSGIRSGVVVGDSPLISDAAVRAIFDLPSDAQIIDQ